VKPASARPLWPLLLLIAAACAFPAPRHHVAHRPTATPVAATTPARLAIIIDDCGQWLATERAFIALPVPLTLSVLPDVRYTKVIAGEATAAGKGVMLHLPMEALSGVNPGPGKVTTEMSDAQIAAQVKADLADVPLARGVNNHEGSKATGDARVMHDVAEALVEHGNLFFIDSMTVRDSVAAAQARGAGLPTATRDVFLDNKADVAYTESQLDEAAALAIAHGSAVAIGHPRKTTLEALRRLIPQLEARGIRFVLVSELLAGQAQPTP